jgi:hypothetical protein
MGMTPTCGSGANTSSWLIVVGPTVTLAPTFVHDGIASTAAVVCGITDAPPSGGPDDATAAIAAATGAPR